MHLHCSKGVFNSISLNSQEAINVAFMNSHSLFAPILTASGGTLLKVLFFFHQKASGWDGTSCAMQSRHTASSPALKSVSVLSHPWKISRNCFNFSLIHEQFCDNESAAIIYIKPRCSDYPGGYATIAQFCHNRRKSGFKGGLPWACNWGIHPWVAPKTEQWGGNYICP